MRPIHGMLAVAAATAALAASASASETYTFSGTASYFTQGGGTGGYYSFTFTSPDSIDTSSPGYQYLYDATGTVTLTPYVVAPYNPIQTGVLSGTFTLVDNLTAGLFLYGATGYESGDEIFAALGVTADLTTPGSVTATSGNSDIYSGDIDLSSISSNPGFGGYVELVEPTSGVTFTVAPAPEPATWGLMLLGSAFVGAMARRRRQPGRSAGRA